MSTRTAIGFDMGATTTKTAVVRDGKIILRGEIIETRQDGDTGALIDAFIQEIRRLKAIHPEAGFQSAQGSIIATAGIGLVNVLMTVISIPLLDRLGRRPLLLASLSGMSLSLAALGLGFAIGGAALKWIGVLSLAVYIASFAIGLGPIFWLLISEIYPLRIRGQAASIATMANWLSNFVVSITFLSLLQRLGSVSTFLLYAALSLAGLWFCFCLVPETKGVGLEKIERDLLAGRPLRQLGKTS
ncbi:MAG: MFS transporter [Verrucomicrobia bacterium]|nr:MFS transporter [Verrucomicrobiota bacterium]